MRKRLAIIITVLTALIAACTLCGCLSSSQASSSGSSANASSSSQSGSSAKSSSSQGSSSAKSSSSKSSSSSSSSRLSSSTTVSGESYAESNLTGDTYQPPNITVVESGQYTDKDSVALYIHQFGHVPSNYVSKTKARDAGWESTKGNLWDVLPGKSIGGGGFYNDDGMMPDAPGREWFECDIDYEGGYRNAKRLVYSDDGLIYYTDDHYNTFQRLY